MATAAAVFPVRRHSDPFVPGLESYGPLGWSINPVSVPDKVKLCFL